MVIFYAVAFVFFNFYHAYHTACFLNIIQVILALANWLMFSLGYKRLAKFCLPFFSLVIVFIYQLSFEPDTLAYFYYVPIISLSMAFLSTRANLESYVNVSISVAAVIFLQLSHFKLNPVTLTNEELQVIKLLNTLGPLLITLIVLYSYNKLSMMLHYELTNEGKKLIQLNERLNKNVHERNRLFSLISHDLRGPIMSIHRGISLISAHDLNPMNREKIIQGILNKSKQTYELLNDMFVWLNFDKKSILFNPSVVELLPLLNKVRAFYMDSAADRDIGILIKDESTGCAFFDKNMIEAVLRNLLSNALKYSPRGSVIKLIAYKEGNGIRVEIIDSGKGIDQQVIEKIRSNTVKSSVGIENESGFGFGLRLCADFLACHNSKLDFDLECSIGTRVGFYLNRDYI